MTVRRRHGCFQIVLVGALLCTSSGLLPVSHAQVTTSITPSGLGTAVAPQSGSNVDITGGQRHGTNLFHSFGNFSVGAGVSANFLNTPARPATSNILSRVTGGNPSSIFGTINTLDFPGANLFLMNPAGIVFGPTAQLNVSGSFHATTADYIKLGNDGVFYADPTKPTVLSVAPPSAFGFLPTHPPAPIEVQTGGIDFNTSENRTLAVPEGQTLSLVGGTLNLGAAEIRDGSGNIVQGAQPAYLLAPGGRVNLISVASAGEAAFNGTGFNIDGFARLGDIKIRGGRILLDVGEGPTELLFLSIVDGKEVFVRGGKLEMSEAIISPGVLSSYVPSPDGGEVNIAVTGDATITGSGSDILLGSFPGIYTRAGAFFAPQNSPDAKVPDITINAGSLTLSGIASVKTDRFGPGTPASVVVNADTVTVRDAASIVSLNFYDGVGGNIEINAREVDLSGDGTLGPHGVTGIAAQNLIHPCFLCEQPDVIDSRLTSANAGTITVNASETLSVSGNALIVTDNLGFGRGGDIVINAGNINVTGVGPDTAGIRAQSAFVGDAGDITITASGTINLKDGGQIAGTTVGSGKGSNVAVTAGESITFTGADSRIVNATGPAPVDELNRLFSLAFQQSFEEMRDSLGLPMDASIFDVLGAFLNDLGFTPMPDLTPGNAGTVTINTPLLTLNANTRIEMSTGWEGDAGALTANVGSLSVNDDARITSRSGIQRLTGEVVVGSGDAGEVNIAATDNISVSGAGSTISTSTLGDGAAGNISLSANQVNVENGGSVSSASGVTVNGQLFVGAGNAGQISVSAPTLTMADGTISVATSGAGSAGSILLNGNTLSLTGGSQVVSSTTGSGQGGSVLVTASESASFSGVGSGLFSTTSATGNAGEIALSTPTLTMANGGTISVATSGIGNAGNISLNVGDFAQTGGARVDSSTTSTGQGGNLTLTASESASFSGSGSGLFSTASSTGNAGQITVTASALAPVPTLTMADGGTISVATSGAGSAGSILLNANAFNLTNGAQVVSSTSGSGQGGSVTLTATESASFSGLGSGLLSTASSTGNAGEVTVSTPNLAMSNGAISVATSGAGNAGNVLLNVNNFSLTGGAQILSSTISEGQGGNVTLSAADSISISGQGTGLFSTAASTGNAGQITVTAAALAPVPTLAMADGGKISVETLGAGSAGRILLNANNFSLTGGAQVVSSTSGSGQGGSVTLTATESASFSGLGSGLLSTASSTGNAGEVTVSTPTLAMANGGTISVATSNIGNAGSISLNVSEFTQTGGARVESSTSGAGAGGTLGLTASELVSISGTGSGLFSTAESTGNAGQVTVAAPGSTPVPTLSIADGGKISVATSGGGTAGSISLNANTFSLTGGAQVVSSTTGAGQGGSVTVSAPGSLSVSGSGTAASGLFSTAESTGSAGQIAVTTPALTMGDGGTISVETSNIGNAGSISLNVNNFTQTGGARVESSTNGAGAGGTLGLTASELVSISGTGSGLFSTASSTGNAGQITVSAPALVPVPTLTMADGGKISVATSGGGTAGSISLNANTFSLTGGAQVVSSTTGAGQGGSVTVSAPGSLSVSGSGTAASGLFSTAESTGSAGQIAVTTPALTMGDGGTISVATSNIGNAGSISLNVSEFTQTGGARVESSTSGAGAGGTLGLTASELVSISGTGSGLFSTAESTGNAGQVTVAAPGSTPVPTLSIADGGKISVETLGAGSAGSILLNANTLSLTGGAQVVSNTTGAGQGGSVKATAGESVSISGSGSLPSGLFSTASSTGNAGEVTVSTPTLAMANGGTISVATSGAGNAGNVSLNVSNFNLTGGAQIVSSTSGAGQGGSVSANATNLASISGQGTGMFSNASGTGAGGTINIQAAQLQITDAGAISANSTGSATATAGNVNIVAGELVQMQNGSITTESTLADGGNISITTTGSMVRLNDSQITTSVGSGAGSGGNITIGSDFVLLNNTEIRADAFGGPGGNITIVAGTFLRSNSIVSASSALSTPGTIAIEATFTDVTGSFAQLPSTPLEATELLRASCAARLAGGKASSLVVGGRDGVPLQPGSLLPSPLYVSDPSIAPKSITQEMPLRFTLLGSKDRLSNQYSLLPNAKCSS